MDESIDTQDLPCVQLNQDEVNNRPIITNKEQVIIKNPPTKQIQENKAKCSGPNGYTTILLDLQERTPISLKLFHKIQKGRNTSKLVMLWASCVDM